MSMLQRFFIPSLFLNMVFLSLSAALAEESYTVVGTTGMISDIVREIGGERVNVLGLIGPGVDPHLFKPTRSDMALLIKADIIFYNGLYLEGKLTDALEKLSVSGKPVVAVSEFFPKDKLLQDSTYQGQFDPHVWMDPELWLLIVDGIHKRLAEFDQPGRAYYTANAERLKLELRDLAAYSTKVLSSVPEEARILVTAHDAFNYFGRRFGYTVLGIQGLSTESEAGVQDLEKIVGVLVEKKVKAVFVESTVSERNVQALIEGARARGHMVKIGGELFSDAMGASGSYEGTYIGMIDHNVTTIAHSLGGSVPQRGMSGKLKQE